MLTTAVTNVPSHTVHKSKTSLVYVYQPTPLDTGARGGDTKPLVRCTGYVGLRTQLPHFLLLFQQLPTVTRQQAALCRNSCF